MRVNDKLTPRARPVGLEIGAHFVIFTVYKSKIPLEMEVALTAHMAYTAFTQCQTCLHVLLYG